MCLGGKTATAIQVDENTSDYWNVGHCGTSPSSQYMQVQSLVPRSSKNAWYPLFVHVRAVLLHSSKRQNGLGTHTCVTMDLLYPLVAYTNT